MLPREVTGVPAAVSPPTNTPCLPLPPDALRLLLLTQLLTDAAQGVAGAAAAAVLLPLMPLPTTPLLMPCCCWGPTQLLTDAAPGVAGAAAGALQNVSRELASRLLIRFVAARVCA